MRNAQAAELGTEPARIFFAALSRSGVEIFVASGIRSMSRSDRALTASPAILAFGARNRRGSAFRPWRFARRMNA